MKQEEIQLTEKSEYQLKNQMELKVLSDGVICFKNNALGSSRHLIKLCRICNDTIQTKPKRHYENQHSVLTQNDIDYLMKTSGLFLKQGWKPLFPIISNWEEVNADISIKGKEHPINKLKQNWRGGIDHGTRNDLLYALSQQENKVFEVVKQEISTVVPHISVQNQESNQQSPNKQINKGELIETKQKIFWESKPADEQGVYANNLNGKQYSINMLKEFLYKIMQRGLIHHTDLCLELASGGPLNLFTHILINLVYVTDINEIADNQMKATIDTESKINKQKTKFEIGNIGERFHMPLDKVPLDKKYSFIIGHYTFGYLPDEQLFLFLQRSRVELIKGRPIGKQAVIIVKESIADDGEDNYVDGDQLLHIRTTKWYMDTFRTYGFAIVEKQKHNRKNDKYTDEMMFCLLPIPIRYPGQLNDTNKEVDAVCVVGKNTKRFCCGQNCFEREFHILEEQKQIFQVDNTNLTQCYYVPMEKKTMTCEMTQTDEDINKCFIGPYKLGEEQWSYVANTNFELWKRPFEEKLILKERELKKVIEINAELNGEKSILGQQVFNLKIDNDHKDDRIQELKNQVNIQKKNIEQLEQALETLQKHGQFAKKELGLSELNKEHQQLRERNNFLENKIKNFEQLNSRGLRKGKENEILTNENKMLKQQLQGYEELKIQAKQDEKICKEVQMNMIEQEKDRIDTMIKYKAEQINKDNAIVQLQLLESSVKSEKETFQRLSINYFNQKEQILNLKQRLQQYEPLDYTQAENTTQDNKEILNKQFNNPKQLLLAICNEPHVESPDKDITSQKRVCQDNNTEDTNKNWNYSPNEPLFKKRVKFNNEDTVLK